MTFQIILSFSQLSELFFKSFYIFICLLKFRFSHLFSFCPCRNLLAQFCLFLCSCCLIISFLGFHLLNFKCVRPSSSHVHFMVSRCKLVYFLAHFWFSANS